MRLLQVPRFEFQPWRPLRRWSGTFVAVAIALAAVVGVTAAVLGFRSRAEVAPPWRGDLTGCRQDPMAHVHHPSRLALLGRCATVTGTVRGIRLETAYDDLKIVIAPDPAYRGYLRPGNRDTLVADVIATDLPRVPKPAPGTHVTVSGAWVLNRAKDTVELHPAYRIVAPGERSTPFGETAAKHGRAVLELAVDAPAKVPVGRRMDAFVHARWVRGDERRPASQVRLFAELTTVDGTGVRWRSLRTDTRGAAVMHLLAVTVPGPYRLTVYATPAGRDTTAAAHLTVTRR